jgi:hypothetical protein
VFSPDGNWIAYTSDDSTRREFYVTAFSRPGSSPAGLHRRRRAAAVFARRPPVVLPSRDRIFVADVLTQPSLSTSAPRVAFEIPDASVNTALPFRVSTNGDRLLYPKEPRPQSGRTIHVIVNWFEDLRRITAAQ